MTKGSNLSADAGAGVVQPEGSTLGVRNRSLSPLQLPPALSSYVASLPEVLHAQGKFGVTFLYLAPPSILARVMLGKWTITEGPEAFYVTDKQGITRVIPRTMDPATYVNAVMAKLDAGEKLYLVPAALREYLTKAGYKVTLAHHEFYALTDTLAGLEGPRLARVRNYARGWARNCDVLDLSAQPQIAEEMLTCNTLWYRQQEKLDTKFRLYDKTVIEWIVRNWETVTALDPNARAIAARSRETGKIIGINIASTVSEAMWADLVRHHDMGVNNIAMFLFADQAKHFKAKGYPHMCDGTADTKTLRQMKERYGTPMLTAFNAERARRGV